MNKDALKNIEKIIAQKDLYAKYDDNKELITWCSGCGNYNIQNALKRALTLEEIPTEKALFCFDVGCNGNGSDKMGGYTFHGLHGRVISLAAGAKIGNPDLKVVAFAGDGGTFSEGVNHLVHAIRNDYPILFLHHNNSNYALTTGQPSATTKPGYAMNSAPDGIFIDPLNPLDLVFSLNPTFVARTFSGDIKHMTAMMQEGLRHKGFAFLEIFQLCPTYDKSVSQTWYWDRLKKLENIPDYDPTNMETARQLARDIENDIHVGVLYQDKEKPNFMQRLPNRQNTETTPKDEVQHFDISNLMKEFE